MKIKCALLIILPALIMLCSTRTACAGHYTIKLTNGKEIVVKKYWDEGKTIRFYSDGGSVGIAKEDIKNIVPQAGDAPVATTGNQVISLPDAPEVEPEVKDAAPVPNAEKQTEKEQLEIREKIELIKANTATLTERKNKLEAKRTVAFDAKLKAEEQLEKTRSTPYMTTADRRQAEEGAQRKIIEAETQIKDADQAIGAVDEMLAQQEALMKQLEDRQR